MPEFDLGTVFLFAFFVGLFFALVSVVLTGFGGGFDAHHIDIAPTGGDILGHGDLVGGHQTAGHELHFSPFSTPVLASFAAAFGGGGYIAFKILGYSAVVSVLVAIGVGLVGAFLLFFLISKLLIKQQASSEPRTNELIGTTAEVTVGIPKGGTGEIGYTTMGSRYTGPAVSTSGEEIPARTIVLIHRITSGLFHVEPARAGARPSQTAK